MTTTVTKSAARRQRNESLYTKALRSMYAGKQFAEDSKGRTVRVDRASHEEIAAFLRGNRVVNQLDIMAELGNAAFDALVQSGHLKRSAAFNRFRSDNLYWVTDKAQAYYGLPAKIELVCGASVDYAPAPRNVN